MAPLAECSPTIYAARQESCIQAACMWLWEDERELFDHDPGTGLTYGYVRELPQFRDDDLTRIIQRKIQDASGDRVTLLDVGCGRKGRFLQSCNEQWPGVLSGIGVAADIDIDAQTTLANASNPIELIPADIHAVDEIVGENVADIIVSCWAFLYLSDPWAAVQAVHRALKPGGIALIHNVPYLDAVEDASEKRFRFLSGMRKLHMEVESNDWGYMNLSWQKTTDDLRIPLSYTGKHMLVMLSTSDVPYGVDRACYRVD